MWKRTGIQRFRAGKGRKQLSNSAATVTLPNSRPLLFSIFSLRFSWEGGEYADACRPISNVSFDASFRACLHFALSAAEIAIRRQSFGQSRCSLSLVTLACFADALSHHVASLSLRFCWRSLTCLSTLSFPRHLSFRSLTESSAEQLAQELASPPLSLHHRLRFLHFFRSYPRPTDRDPRPSVAALFRIRSTATGSATRPSRSPDCQRASRPHTTLRCTSVIWCTTSSYTHIGSFTSSHRRAASTRTVCESAFSPLHWPPVRSPS